MADKSELSEQKLEYIREYVNESDPKEEYELLRSIGTGTYGEVYKAVCRRTKELVAVKKIKVDAKDDVRAILQEIQTLRDCRHNNIVQYFGSYFRNNKLWICMEFCGGFSMQDIYTNIRRPIEENCIAFVTRETLRGIEYMHAIGKIHRDIKGANILLTDCGDVKIADFGVAAQITQTIQRRSSFIGTPYWMAPEVAAVERKGGYDEKCDIWAVGITAIEYAEQQPPLYDLHPMRALRVLGHRNYKPPTLRNKSTWSSRFHGFLKAALTKNEKKRPNAQTLLRHDLVNQSCLSRLLTRKLLEFNRNPDILKLVHGGKPSAIQASRPDVCPPVNHVAATPNSTVAANAVTDNKAKLDRSVDPKVENNKLKVSPIAARPQPLDQMHIPRFLQTAYSSPSDTKSTSTTVTVESDQSPKLLATPVHIPPVRVCAQRSRICNQGTTNVALPNYKKSALEEVRIMDELPTPPPIFPTPVLKSPKGSEQSPRRTSSLNNTIVQEFLSSQSQTPVQNESRPIQALVHQNQILPSSLVTPTRVALSDSSEIASSASGSLSGSSLSASSWSSASASPRSSRSLSQPGLFNAPIERMEADEHGAIENGSVPPVENELQLLPTSVNGLRNRSLDKEDEVAVESLNTDALVQFIDNPVCVTDIKESVPFHLDVCPTLSEFADLDDRCSAVTNAMDTFSKDIMQCGLVSEAARDNDSVHHGTVTTIDSRSSNSLQSLDPIPTATLPRYESSSFMHTTVTDVANAPRFYTTFHVKHLRLHRSASDSQICHHDTDRQPILLVPIGDGDLGIDNDQPMNLICDRPDTISDRISEFGFRIHGSSSGAEDEVDDDDDDFDVKDNELLPSVLYKADERLPPDGSIVGSETLSTTRSPTQAVQSVSDSNGFQSNDVRSVEKPLEERKSAPTDGTNSNGCGTQTMKLVDSTGEFFPDRSGEEVMSMLRELKFAQKFAWLSGVDVFPKTLSALTDIENTKLNLPDSNRKAPETMVNGVDATYHSNKDSTAVPLSDAGSTVQSQVGLLRFPKPTVAMDEVTSALTIDVQPNSGVPPSDRLFYTGGHADSNKRFLDVEEFNGSNPPTSTPSLMVTPVETVGPVNDQYAYLYPNELNVGLILDEVLPIDSDSVVELCLTPHPTESIELDAIIGLSEPRNPASIVSAESSGTCGTSPSIAMDHSTEESVVEVNVSASLHSVLLVSDEHSMCLTSELESISKESTIPMDVVPSESSVSVINECTETGIMGECGLSSNQSRDQTTDVLPNNFLPHRSHRHGSVSLDYFTSNSIMHAQSLQFIPTLTEDYSALPSKQLSPLSNEINDYVSSVTPNAASESKVRNKQGDRGETVNKPYTVSSTSANALDCSTQTPFNKREQSSAIVRFRRRSPAAFRRTRFSMIELSDKNERSLYTDFSGFPSTPKVHMGACFSQIFDGCPLKVNATATWINPMDNDQILLFGTNDGIYYLSFKAIPDGSLELLFPRRCLWLSVVCDTMLSLSGRHPQLYSHNLVSLMNMTTQGHAIKGSMSKLGKLAKLFPKRFSPSKKIPGTKGCQRANIVRSPFTGAKYLCAAINDQLLVMEWLDPVSSFVEIKRILVPDMPFPLLTFDLLISKNRSLPLVCLGVYRHHSRQGREHQRYRLQLVDLNQTSTDSSVVTNLLNSVENVSSTVYTSVPVRANESFRSQFSEPLKTDSDKFNSSESRKQEQRAECQRRNATFLPEDALPVVEVVQLEHNTFLVCLQDCAKVIGLNGRIKPNRYRATTLDFGGFVAESIVCLRDSILVFHPHGLLGKNFTGELTQEINDERHIYRLLGRDRNVIVETRPTNDPMSDSNIYLLAGHTDSRL